MAEGIQREGVMAASISACEPSAPSCKGFQTTLKMNYVQVLNIIRVTFHVLQEFTMQNTIVKPMTDKIRKRHPILSIWLTLIIVYSVTFTILYLAGAGDVNSVGSSAVWAIPVLMVLLILQAICAIALFAWKKWGFWGYSVVNLIGLIVDVLIGVNLIGPIITVLVGVAGLYGVLHIGLENKGWPQLN
jgi:hypothetical protein